MKTTITYLLYKSKTNSKGLWPIRCRITYNKSRKSLSTGLMVNPLFWNSKKQQAEPPEPDENYINTQLSLIRQNLNQAFLFLQVKGTPFTVLDIYKQYKGETPKDELGVIKVVRIHNEIFLFLFYRSDCKIRRLIIVWNIFFWYRLCRSIS